jgi:hypothetical protein
VDRKTALGTPIAQLFEGGARESLLRAVAEVCSQGRSVRFRARERGVCFTAIASPIVAEGSQVGVVILLKEEIEGVERLLAFGREIVDAIEDVGLCLSGLVDETGGRRADQHRVSVEDGMRALARLRKWAEELTSELTGTGKGARGEATVDPACAVRSAAATVAGDAQEVGTALEVLVPVELPLVQGEPAEIESLLVRMLRDRLSRTPPPAFLNLSARVAGGGERAAVMISLGEPAVADGEHPQAEESPLVEEIVGALGGTVLTTNDPELGRTTAIRLPFRT